MRSHRLAKFGLAKFGLGTGWVLGGSAGCLPALDSAGTADASAPGDVATAPLDAQSSAESSMNGMTTAGRGQGNPDGESPQCSSGSCECEGGLTLCSSGCVDTTIDSANCGRCDHSCQGADCSGTPPMCQPIVLATGQFYVQGLAVRSGNLYWSNTMSGVTGAAGTIMTLSVDGGTPAIFASGQDSPGSVVTDETNVYWTDDSSGLVMSKNRLDGGMATLASGQNIPVFIAVDSANVYFDTYSGGTIVSVPLDGGASTTLATGQIAPWAIGVTASYVYWANYGGTVVSRAPIHFLEGAEILVPGPQDDGGSVAGGGGLALNGADVYFSVAGGTGNGGTLMSIPLAGGTPASVATGQNGVGAVTLDATNVYWTDSSAVMAASLDGGAPITLVSGQSEPGSLAVDSTTIYWANYAKPDGGQVMKVAKP